MSIEHRVTRSQQHELLDFLAEHPRLANSTGTGQREKDNHDRLWENIARRLNSHAAGAKKTGLRWKRYWADIKHKSKQRVLNSKRQSNSSALGDVNDDELGDVDKKILEIISKGPRRRDDLNFSHTSQFSEHQYEEPPPYIKLSTSTSQHKNEDNDEDPLVQYITLKEYADEDEVLSHSENNTNSKKSNSKTSETAWLMELEERRIVNEEKLAEAASQMARAAILNAESSQTMAQATLLLAQNQQTLINMLKANSRENNT